MAFGGASLGFLHERAFGWESLFDTMDVYNTLHYTLLI